MRPESNVRNQAAQATARRPEAHSLPTLLAQTVPESENDSMTKIEQAEIVELGMTPEALAAKTREVEASLRTNTKVTTFDPATVEAMPTPPARTRRTRSDKGTMRPAKPKPVASEPVQAGALTAEQAEKLGILVGAIQRTTAEHMQKLRETEQAAASMFTAQCDYNKYVESLIGK